VYDVTKFLKLHPGGKKVLLGVGGQECTEQFNQFHNPAAVLAKYGPKLIVGELAGGAPKKEKAAAPAAAAAPKAQSAPSSPSTALTVSPAAPFGDQIPYGDASWSEHTHEHRVMGMLQVRGSDWRCPALFASPLFLSLTINFLLI